ncbi:hypothetical protein TELCIR_02987 [Teladorsagia circumcincta]|uniref:Uncharacterized protein n=1 Tax=Teladorsagia circumcincta TaxID=45464 RepID=A0A2G9UXN7_TELCI|nr:hypothetical protein TELCIR_02987 [Teladorsagia circumcincta]
MPRLFAFCGLLRFALVFPMKILGPSYSDEFARTNMLPLAAAAYSNMPQECLENRFTNATLKRQLNVTCGPFANNDVCSGFTAVIHGKKAIVISFRGTDTYLQLVAEADLSVFHEKVFLIISTNIRLSRVTKLKCKTQGLVG